MSLLQRLEELLACTQQAASTARGAQRLQQHLLATLLCPERCTLTNLLCTGGLQQQDWSAHYRCYSHQRVDIQVLFDEVCHQVQQALRPQAPLVVAMDDTLVRKCGAHIHGVRWRRDPLGPPFQTNLVRGQRYLQFSAAWPTTQQGQARMLPIGFYHVPGAGKPARDADAAALAAHKELRKQRGLNTQTLAQMKRLRTTVPATRPLVFTGDGSYTNKEVLQGLPQGSCYIGRLRKDAVLHFLPPARLEGAMGRPLRYGAQAPTPEALRQDAQVPWQQVEAFAAGKVHQIRVKTLEPLLWPKAGAGLQMRLVVIAPLAYRLRKGSKVLYRQPAHVVCTDVHMPLAEVVQHYLWRWGIEVNFREQKTLLGTGEAQVRTEASNQQLPAMTVAAYALLWTAALSTAHGLVSQDLLKPPKWRARGQGGKTAQPATGDLLRRLRHEVWAGAIRPATYRHFTHTPPSAANTPKPLTSLPSTLFCAA